MIFIEKKSGKDITSNKESLKNLEEEDIEAQNYECNNLLNKERASILQNI